MASIRPESPLTQEQVGALLAGSPARWWLSGGAALDRWLGQPIRERRNIDVSTTSRDLDALIAALPPSVSAWAPASSDGGDGGEDESGLDDDAVLPWSEAPRDADLHPVRLRDHASGAWLLRIDVEDGTDSAWLYRRDPRLQLPWDRAVIDVDGMPTGAPEVQLVWKALRPRPEDETDKDAVLPLLPDDARAWFERTILRVHPHSTWSIHVRSPLTPAKASWNRPAR